MTELEYERYRTGLEADGHKPIGAVNIVPERPIVPIDWESNPFDTTGTTPRFYIPPTATKSENS